MSNYKESTVTGSAWQRCHQVVIENPLGGTPVVRFDEEEVLSASTGQTVRRPVPGIVLPFDPSKPFPLRNPATGDLIPGAASTYGDAYVLLYSAYMAAAEERDAALAPQLPIEINQE